MNLAIVNARYQFGGAESIARDLIEGCAAAGHDARLYVAAGKTYVRSPGVVPLYPRFLSRLHHTRLSGLLERVAPRATWTDRRFRALTDGPADVVHLHSFHGEYATLDSLAHVARRKPFVWTFHAHWGVTGGCDHPLDCTRYEDACGSCPRVGVWPIGSVDDTEAQLRAKVDRLAVLSSLHVVAPSEYLAARIRRSRVGRRWHVHHIPNGVPVNLFSTARKTDPNFRQNAGLEPDCTSVLVVNRDYRDREKGFPLVREALLAVDPRRRVQVMLAGDHSEEAAADLPPSLRSLSLGYVAARSKMATLLEAADILLFGSPAENFPCAVLEGMAAGCCVVATPSGGVTEQVVDGRSGILARDVSGAALGAALNVALEDPALRTRLGADARARVEALYGCDRMVRRHLELYEDAVAAQIGGA